MKITRIRNNSRERARFGLRDRVKSQHTHARAHIRTYGGGSYNVLAVSVLYVLTEK